MGCLLGHIETRIEMVFLLYTQRDPHCCESLLSFIPGSVLLSHPVAREVPSALEVLTAVFEMGTGITPPLWPPGNVIPVCLCNRIAGMISMVSLLRKGSKN